MPDVSDIDLSVTDPDLFLCKLLNICALVGHREKVEVTESQVPKPILSDYLELAYLSIVVLLGVPFNIHVLQKLVFSYHGCRLPVNIKTAFIVLKINLTTSNLFILLLYCPAKIVWLSTYRWIGGDTFCPIMNFVWMLSFHLSSNNVAVIALDRLRVTWTSLSNPTPKNLMPSPGQVMNPIKVLIVICYVWSVLCSVPQLFVWRVVEVERNWCQCTTIWNIQRFRNQNSEEYDMGEQLYQLVHLITVFWLPLLLVVLCYSLIMCKIVEIQCCRPRQKNVTTQRKFENSEATVTTSFINNKGNTATNIAQKTTNDTLAADETGCLLAQAQPSMCRERLQSQLTISRGTVWRSQIKSRIFKTSGLIVGTFIVLWLPYNFLALYVFAEGPHAKVIAENGQILKGLVILNALMNPLLYGGNEKS